MRRRHGWAAIPGATFFLTLRNVAVEEPIDLHIAKPVSGQLPGDRFS